MEKAWAGHSFTAGDRAGVLMHLLRAGQQIFEVRPVDPAVQSGKDGTEPRAAESSLLAHWLCGLGQKSNSSDL